MSRLWLTNTHGKGVQYSVWAESTKNNDEIKLISVTIQEVKRKTALLCQKLTHGRMNLILLTNVKLFEKNLSAHKTLQTKCCWPDDRFWGLHDYITQRHTLTLLRHHTDSLLQRQRFVQKLLRETLWLDGGWDVFLVFSDCTHPDTFSSKCLLCRGSFQEKWHVLEMWKIHWSSVNLNSLK